MAADAPEHRWKMIYLARRNPQLAAEDFAQAWREHSALGRQCRNVQDRVRSVTQCVRSLATLPADARQDYDGVNLLLLRDRDSADAIWSDPETLAIMRPDEPRVFDRYVRDCALVAREQLLRDGPQGDAVLLVFLKCHSTLQPADWAGLPSRQTTPASGAQQLMLNLVEPQRPSGYDYDAILEWWFQDEPQMLQALAGRGGLDSLPVELPSACERDSAVVIAARVSHRRP